jgi:hypothetical protein
MFTFINLKLELEYLMGELKQDIWGKHEAGLTRDEQVSFFLFF